MIRRPPRSTLFPTRRSSDLTRPPGGAGGDAIAPDAVLLHTERIDGEHRGAADRKSTRLNSSHGYISYAVFCLKKQTLREPVHDVSLRGRESDADRAQHRRRL